MWWLCCSVGDGKVNYSRKASRGGKDDTPQNHFGAFWFLFLSHCMLICDAESAAQMESWRFLVMRMWDVFTLWFRRWTEWLSSALCNCTHVSWELVWLWRDSLGMQTFSDWRLETGHERKMSDPTKDPHLSTIANEWKLQPLRSCRVVCICTWVMPRKAEWMKWRQQQRGRIENRSACCCGSRVGI